MENVGTKFDLKIDIFGREFTNKLQRIGESTF